MSVDETSRVLQAIGSLSAVLSWPDEDNVDDIETELEDLRSELVDYLNFDDLQPPSLGMLLAALAEKLEVAADDAETADTLSELVQNVAYGTFHGDVSELQDCASVVRTFLERLEAKLESQLEENDNEE
jgi:hypothetical protein